MSAGETLQMVVRVASKDIVRLRVIIEAYEGLARCTTLDDQSTVVQITYLRDQEADVRFLLQSLEQEGWLTIASGPDPVC